MDPRQLDLDDTRFDVEVIDLKSKEMSKDLDQEDASPEFSSNEDNMDRLLLSPPERPGQEDDIAIDDPEIDLEQPTTAALVTEKPDDEEEEDVSEEEENEWARVLAMRQEASVEIADISSLLDQERQETHKTNDDELDDDDEDDEPGPRRLLLHPIRPFPQMVPAPERTIHVEPEDASAGPDPPVENNFPPSYHAYPIDSLSHAGESQRRKAIVLLVLTCAIVLSTMAFVVCYVKEYCRRRATTYNRVLVVNMSAEEREIVRQSANILERMEKPTKKFRGDSSGYAAMVDDDSEANLCVTENPLEAYLNATDERYVAREPLVENEVLHDPKVHRRPNA